MFRKSLLTLLIVFGGLFNEGCSLEQKAADFLEAKVKELGPILEKRAADAADKAIKAKSDKELAALDAQLALIHLKDDQGNDLVKTWKDFSADHGASGSLAPGEIAKAGLFIAQNTAKAVATGEITKTQGAQRLKDGGIALGALGLLGLLWSGIKKLTGKTAPSPAPVAGASTSPPDAPKV
jgi:hypothetical protein